ncbi:hypothetical protein G6514_005493 [Epicoccum nigrum]|nr:hypothetical protein G6514_005493 [Epicoccum nigrum]
MAVNEDVEAKRLGERLLVDVQVEGLSEIHSESNSFPTADTPFNIPELDTLLPPSRSTILELVSPSPSHHPSGAGKTSLLYLLIAQAILPPTHPSIPFLNGHSGAVVLLDPLHHFSVPRLASVILNLLVSKLPSPTTPLDASTKASLLSTTATSLDHVHIFHPSSWASLVSTLQSLPGYLFSGTRHKSTQRRIHSLILDDADAFTWPLRAAHADKASPARSTASSPLAAASRQLTAQIKSLTAQLACHAVLASSSLAPSSFRPPLPTAWPAGLDVTRLAVRRVEVVRFAPEMSVEQAEGEKGQRGEVVRRGRFEAWKVGGTATATATATGLGLGLGRGQQAAEGFVFRVGERGVEMERGAG